MVNVGFSPGSLLGIIMILGSLGYCFVSISQIVTAARSSSSGGMVLRISQLLFGPAILFLSGLILFVHGWRLDPLLLFQNFLMTLLVAYLIILDLSRR